MRDLVAETPGKFKFSQTGAETGPRNLANEVGFSQQLQAGGPPLTEMFWTPKDTEAFMKTLEGYKTIARNPGLLIEATNEFVSALPSFGTGLIEAGQDLFQAGMSDLPGSIAQKFLPPFMRKDRGLSIKDYYDISAEGFQRGFEKLPRIHPSNPEATALIIETMFAPFIVNMELFHRLSESDVLDGVPEEDNIRGTLKFVGDLSSFYLDAGITGLKSSPPFYRAKGIKQLAEGKPLKSKADYTNLLKDIKKDVSKEFDIDPKDPRLKTAEGRQEIINGIKSDYEAQGYPVIPKIMRDNQMNINLMPKEQIGVTGADHGRLAKTHLHNLIDQNTKASELASRGDVGALVSDYSVGGPAAGPIIQALSEQSKIVKQRAERGSKAGKLRDAEELKARQEIERQYQENKPKETGGAANPILGLMRRQSELIRQRNLGTDSVKPGEQAVARQQSLMTELDKARKPKAEEEIHAYVVEQRAEPKAPLKQAKPVEPLVETKPTPVFHSSDMIKKHGVESLVVDGVTEYDLYGKRKFKTEEAAYKALNTDKRLVKKQQEMFKDGLELEVVKVGDEFRFAENMDMTQAEQRLIENYLSKKGKPQEMDLGVAESELRGLGEQVKDWHQGKPGIDIEIIKERIASLSNSFVREKPGAKGDFLVDAGDRMLQLITERQAELTTPKSGKYGEGLISGRSPVNPKVDFIYNVDGKVFQDLIEAVDFNADLRLGGVVEQHPSGGWIIEMKKPPPKTIPGTGLFLKPLLNERGSVDISFMSSFGKRFLRNSKVKKPLYHLAYDLDVLKAGFDLSKSPELGIHLATKEQAINILGRNLGIPIIINTKRPLQLVDKGNFSPNNIIEQLRLNKIITQSEYIKAREQMQKVIENISPHIMTPEKYLPAHNKIVRDLILKKGYDSVRYKNIKEQPSEHPGLKKRKNELLIEARKKAARGEDVTAIRDEVKQIQKDIQSRQLMDSYIVIDKITVKNALDPKLWEESPTTNTFQRIIKDLKTILLEPLLNERGSVSFEKLPPEKLEALRRLQEDARRACKTVYDLVREMGESEAVAKAISELARQLSKRIDMSKPSVGLEDFETGDVISTGKDRKRGEYLVKQPKVYKSELDAIRAAKDPKRSFVGQATKEYVTTPQMIKELDSPYYKQLQRTYWETETRIADMIKDHADGLSKQVKRLNRKSRERIGTNLYWRQKDIRARMEKDGFKESDIPKLTEREQQFVDYIDPLLEDMGFRINQARVSSGLNPIKLIQDDYFTVAYVESFAERIGLSANIIRDNPKVINSRFARFLETPFKYKKRRSKEGLKKQLKFDPVETFDTYMRSAIRHEQMTPLASKIHATLKPLKTGEFYKTKSGKTKERLFMMDKEKPNLARWSRRWANTIAGRDLQAMGTLVDSPANNFIDMAARKLSRNLVVALMSGSIRSAEIQVGALRNTSGRIGLDYTAYGVAEAARLAAKGEFTKVKNRSRVLKTRLADISMTEFFSGVRRGKRALAAKIGLTPLKYMDYSTAVATWLGAEKFALNKIQKAQTTGKFGTLKEHGIEYSKKLSREEMARRFADDIVVETQGSSLVGDIAPIQRSAVGKLVHLFQTFTISDWNMLYKDVFGVNRKLSKKLKAKRMINYLIATTLLNMFFEDVLDINSPMPTPIRAAMKSAEEGKSGAEIALDVAKEMGEPLPLVGGALRYGFSPAGAVVQTFGELFEALSDRSKRSSVLPRTLDSGIARKTALAGESLAKLYGIPYTGQIAKSARAAKRGESPYAIIQGSYSGPKKKFRRF